MRGRAIFLDRDGVINKVILRDGKPYSPRKVEEFILNDEVREVIQVWKDYGFKVIVVSNQPDLGRGEMTEGNFELMVKQMRRELPIDDIYICPHDDSNQCSCRKPKPGMLIEAASKWDIDLSSSFMIGDTWRDMEAGRAAGCKTLLLDAPYNQNVLCDLRVASIMEAKEIILSSISL